MVEAQEEEAGGKKNLEPDIGPRQVYKPGKIGEARELFNTSCRHRRQSAFSGGPARSSERHTMTT